MAEAVCFQTVKHWQRGTPALPHITEEGQAGLGSTPCHCELRKNQNSYGKATFSAIMEFICLNAFWGGKKSFQGLHVKLRQTWPRVDLTTTTITQKLAKNV